MVAQILGVRTCGARPFVTPLLLGLLAVPAGGVCRRDRFIKVDNTPLAVTYYVTMLLLLVYVGIYQVSCAASRLTSQPATAHVTF